METGKDPGSTGVVHATAAEASVATAVTSRGGEGAAGVGAAAAVPLRGVELLLPTYDTVSVALRGPAAEGLHNSVTVHGEVGVRTPLHVVLPIARPDPATLTPVTDMSRGRLLSTVTVVVVDWPTWTD